MDETNLPYLIGRCKEEYLRLLNAASELLRDFDVCTEGGAGDLLARRQEIVASLQRTDGALKRRQVQAGDQRLLEELAEFRKATTERILELDAMVMALARERQATIRTKLSRMSSSKSAVSAYTDHAGGRHAR